LKSQFSEIRPPLVGSLSLIRLRFQRIFRAAQRIRPSFHDDVMARHGEPCHGSLAQAGPVELVKLSGQHIRQLCQKKLDSLGGESGRTKRWGATYPS